MRGVTTRTPERQAEAIRLREEGLTYREIGERLGVSLQAAEEWCNDRDRSRRRARVDRYRGMCDRCGGPTDGSYGPDRAPDLCQSCREWSREEIIVAIRKWADEHGGIPPTCTEWWYADVDHPTYRAAARRFGSWNAALIEAGYALRCDRRPETQAWIEQQVRAGVPVREVAEALGVTPDAIYHRLKLRGIPTPRNRTNGRRR